MKDIPGFEGRYAVTEDGQVWSYPKSWKHENSNRRLSFPGAWIKPQATNGYLRIQLSSHNGARRFEYVHRLVAKLYVPNPDNLPVVNHKDSNRTNNHASNLEWVTPKQNALHCIESGRAYRARGAEVHTAKLTDKDVIAIRAQYRRGGITQEALAYHYGVSERQMHDICNCRFWKHLPC